MLSVLRPYCDQVSSVRFDGSIEFKLEIHLFSRKLEKLWCSDMLSVTRPSSEVVKEGRILQDIYHFFFFLRSLVIDHPLPSISFSLPPQKLSQKQPELVW